MRLTASPRLWLEWLRVYRSGAHILSVDAFAHYRCTIKHLGGKEAGPTKSHMPRFTNSGSARPAARLIDQTEKFPSGFWSEGRVAGVGVVGVLVAQIFQMIGRLFC